MVSAFQQYCSRWQGGCGSGICRPQSKVCLARGTVPCEVLFVGEAPGESENVLGKPFVGPAGHLLDDVIRHGLQGRHTFALTNLVGCIPRDEDGGKATEPAAEDIKVCQQRLIEFIGLCQPRLIVAVGALAAKHVLSQSTIYDALYGNQGVHFLEEEYTLPWLGKDVLMRYCDIMHPAAILRLNVAQKGLAVQRCVVTLQTAVEEL